MHACVNKYIIIMYIMDIMETNSPRNRFDSSLKLEWMDADKTQNSPYILQAIVASSPFLQSWQDGND